MVKLQKNNKNVKRSHLILVILSIFALFLSSCSGGSSGADGASENAFGFGSSSSSGSSSSKSGVSLEFAPGNPPEKISKGEPFHMGFILKNSQEHEIDDLQIKVAGIDWNLVTGLEKQYTVQKISKASTQNPGVFTGLKASGVVFDNFQGDLSFTPEFKYAYTAKTSFVENVCIPSTSKNVCETEFSKSSSQNGPVNVKVDSIYNSGDSEFYVEFSMSNKGNGDLVNEFFETEDYAKKFEFDAKLGTKQGDCTPAQATEYEMTNKKAFARCKFTRDTGDSFSSQIIVNLKYKYQQSTTQKLNFFDHSQR